MLNKKWTVVLDVKCDKGTTGVQFGPDAKFFMTAATNGKVTVFAMKE